LLLPRLVLLPALVLVLHGGRVETRRHRRPVNGEDEDDDDDRNRLGAILVPPRRTDGSDRIIVTTD